MSDDGAFRPYGLIDPDLKGREDLFARMNRETGQCLLDLNRQISFIMKNAGVIEGDPTKETQDVLEFIRLQLDEFEMPNGNWNMDKEYDDLLARGITRTEFRSILNPRGWVNSGLREILNRIKEAAEFECDKSFGFEEIFGKARPKTLGEKFGEQLLIPIRLQEKARFQAIPEEFRIEQRDACFKALNAYLISFELCLRGKIPELR